MLLARADPILTVGAMVAASLYGRDCPIVVCDIAGIGDGDVVAIDASADAGAATSIKADAGTFGIAAARVSSYRGKRHQ